MALTIRDTNPSSVSVEEVMNGQVYSVNDEDDIEQALEMMQQHRVRRLPVLNTEGDLEGILSMNDLVLNATPGKTGSLPYGQVVKTYQAICERPLQSSAAAAAPA
jgi:CBS domain-containing protein